MQHGAACSAVVSSFSAVQDWNFPTRRGWEAGKLVARLHLLGLVYGQLWYGGMGSLM